MKIGMLWFDNDKKTDLITKIEHAADYYQNKYGLRPNLCYVHPSMAPDGLEDKLDKPDREAMFRAGSVIVRASKSVRPNHIWIGVNGHSAA